MTSVVVWDLETVPDLPAAARMLDLPASTPPAEIRAALRVWQTRPDNTERFLPPPLHQIVVIGAVIAHRAANGWEVEKVHAAYVRDDFDEGALITNFNDAVLMKHGQPRLVGFNTNTFDLPVLRSRAMANKVAIPGLMPEYFKRFDESCVDLCDMLPNYDGRGKMGLSELAKVLGLPGKPGEMDGSKVEQLVDARRIADVADYCKGDVVNTYRIWLRYQLSRGPQFLTSAQFEWSEQQLADVVENSRRVAVAA
jgi:predicted PolB exonuclease-like 3'-5' exonuclease